MLHPLDANHGKAQLPWDLLTYVTRSVPKTDGFFTMSFAGPNGSPFIASSRTSRG